MSDNDNPEVYFGTCGPEQQSTAPVPLTAREWAQKYLVCGSIHTSDVDHKYTLLSDILEAFSAARCATLERKIEEHWKVCVELQNKFTAARLRAETAETVCGDAKAEIERLVEEVTRFRKTMNAALPQLEYIERIGCPCGARPESLDTHPHVGGCGIAALLQWARSPKSPEAAGK